MKKILLTTITIAISFFGMAQTPTNGLINHYTFDDATVDDQAGSFDGTNNGAIFTKDRFGTENSALYLDGNDNVTFGDIDITVPNFTFSFWINHNAIPFSKSLRILSKRPACTAGNFFDISLSASNVGMEVYSGSNNAANHGGGAPTQVGKWHHIVLSTDTVNRQTKNYLDGKLMSTKDWGMFVGSIDNSTPFGISTSPCIASNASVENYAGLIDDIAIYNRPLDSTEVLSLFNISKIDSGVLAYYPFNDQTADDKSGNNNHGTEYSISASQDRFGNVNHSYSFDGDSSHVTMPDSLLNQSEISISMWFKTQSFGGLIGHQNTPVNQGSAQYVPIMYVRDDSTLNTRLWNSNVGNTNDSATNYSDNSWHHVIAIGNTLYQEVYIDNVLSGKSTGITVLNNMIYNQIGAAYTSGSWPSAAANWNFFNGNIDDVKIYNRPLMRAEITTLFNEENPVIPTDGISAKKDNQFNIFPNPTSGLITIKSEEKINSIKIIDFTGRVVFSDNSTSTIDLSSFENGIYFIEINTIKGITIKKVVKQN